MLHRNARVFQRLVARLAWHAISARWKVREQNLKNVGKEFVAWKKNSPAKLRKIFAKPHTFILFGKLRTKFEWITWSRKNKIPPQH